MAHKDIKGDLVIKVIIQSLWLTTLLLPMHVDAFCPHLCHCDDLQMIVTCPPESKLDVIPITLNPNLRELHLKENRIRTVDASFQFYGQLEYVDFSKNEMSHLPQRCFASQKKLLKLKMDGNKIANITNATFVGLKSLKSISLQDNLLSSLQENLFVFLSKLEILNLGGNQLTEIHNKAFSKLINLRELHLDNNLLSSIPIDAFKPLTNLQRLFLGGPGNSIHTIEDDAFRYLHSIQYLELGNIDLFNITENAFRGKIQHTIKVLNISNNLLNQFPSVQLSQLNSLEKLYIGGNSDIEIIPEKCLSGLRRLSLIDLAHSLNLVRIESYAFKDNVNLQTIVLDGSDELSMGYSDGRGISENAFTIIPSPSMFSFINEENKRIEINLSLRSMQLETLNQNILENWDTLKSIDLSNNPINCDCNMVWLYDVLSESKKKHEIVNSSSENSSIINPTSLVPCKSPAAVENIQLEHITRTHLENCHDDTSMTKPGAKTQHDQLILVLVCVFSAVFTGIFIFVVVHCRGRHCRFGNDDASSGIQRKCLPTSVSSTTTSTSTSSYSADSIMRGSGCRCCTYPFESCKTLFSICLAPFSFLCCRPKSPFSSSSTSSYEITSCCTFRCCRNSSNILSNNDPQFRSSIYDSSTPTNHYTFGRTSYYVTHPSNGQPNTPHFQQNVNMTLNYDRSTPSIANNGGFGGLIHPLPLSLSAVEATLSHHLCQTRPSQALRHQTLLMPRSCGDDVNIESNAWGTQQKHNKREPKGRIIDQQFRNNTSPQIESVYQELDTCRYDSQYRHEIDPALHVKSNGNISSKSSNANFLIGQQDGLLMQQNINGSRELNPYSVPGEHRINKPPINVLHANNPQTCFHQQNGNTNSENHYQNLKKSNSRFAEGPNSYTSAPNIEHRMIRNDFDTEDVTDIWQKDTRDHNDDSSRSSERYDSDLDEMCNRPRPNDELPHNGLLLTTNLSTEDLTKERRQHFRQHKVSNPNNGGEESCDSGDYFFSLSKDMKTMRAIPVSEL